MDRKRFQHAREEKLRADASRMEKHAHIAAMLRDPKLSALVVSEGLKQVEIWRAQKICSPDYIESWSCLLAHPLLAADMLEDESTKAIQMRQNTPFAALLLKE